VPLSPGLNSAPLNSRNLTFTPHRTMDPRCELVEGVLPSGLERPGTEGAPQGRGDHLCDVRYAGDEGLLSEDRHEAPHRLV